MTSCIYSLLTTVYQYTAAVHLLVTDSDEFLVMTLIAYIWFLMINNQCNTSVQHMHSLITHASIAACIHCGRNQFHGPVMTKYRIDAVEGDTL